jgi:hypothetical protein
VGCSNLIRAVAHCLKYETNTHDADTRLPDYIRRGRDRLNAEREAILMQQREFERMLAEINREYQAVEAYEVAKSSNTAPRQAGARRTGERDRPAAAPNAKTC